MIERRSRRRRDGSSYTVWRVRWHDRDGRERNRTFDTRADAQAFEAKVRTLKRTGDLGALDAGRETLAHFAVEWWELHAAPNLERATLRTYASVWNRHALPRLGRLQLREVTPQAIARFRADLEREGVGAAAVRKTLAMLQGMLERAVEWERIPANPVRAVRKPAGRRQTAVQPLPPTMVEAIRQHLLQGGRHRDAVLVSVLAYAGLRPQEALALTWAHVRDRTVLVEGAVADGDLKALKNRRRPRTVTLLAPLRQDLAEWRLRAGRPADDRLIFDSRDGQAWADHDWRNWRCRTFSPAADAAGVAGATPYVLRHSYASLRLREGVSVVELAAELGHNPTMTLDTYGHVIAELQGTERRSAETEIRAARGEADPAHIRPASGSEA